MTLLEIKKILSTVDHDQIRTDLTKLSELVENPIFFKGVVCGKVQRTTLKGINHICA